MNDADNIEPFLPIGQVKLAVIGAGHVGATFSYAALLSGLVGELVLVDKDHDRARGEAMDLAHSLPFNRPALVRAGDFADIAGAAATVIAAGANQKKGETRLDLAARNADVARDIARRLAEHNPSGLVLVATNPVDVITQIVFEASGLPEPYVLGSGTILDTARFRYLIGSHLGVDPRSVHAYFLGEHGDSSVAVWSSATVGSLPILDFAKARGVPMGPPERESIERQVREAAYAIIAGKGATYYAVASAMARLVEAVLRDQNTVLTVSNHIGSSHGLPEMEGIWMSVPCVVGRCGINGVLPVRVNEEERRALQRSAEVLRKVRKLVE